MKTWKILRDCRLKVLNAEGPEECNYALPHTLMPAIPAALPEYEAWYHERDFVDDYRYLKQVYQVLQYGRPRCRWVLKSPCT
ncbi:hypothetical protein GCM10010381_06600 [Streptomyces xantholiticus]|nr:hypothetical protein GCM10010381_06600 [Streptomyces xantholiticus]